MLSREFRANNKGGKGIMKLYEIKDFDKGTKMRRKKWQDDWYIWFYYAFGRYMLQKSHEDLKHPEYDKRLIVEMLMSPDWEIYKEVKEL